MPNKSPKIIRTSHAGKLVQAKYPEFKYFYRDAFAQEGMARGTAEKVWSGAPDIGMDTVISVMRLVGAERFEDVLEIRLV